MKTSALIATIVFSAFFVFLTTPHAVKACWLGTDGDELIELDRVDNSLHSPLHEPNAGHYGFWRSSSEWVNVLDFSQTNPLILPYTWTTVVWVPNLAKDWPGLSVLTPSDLPVGDLLAKALEGTTSQSDSHTIAPTYGSDLTGILACAEAEAIIVRRFDVGIPA